jgi:hypothetical protein
VIYPDELHRSTAAEFEVGMQKRKIAYEKQQSRVFSNFAMTAMFYCDK